MTGFVRALPVLSLLAAAGCGGEGYAVAEVSGTVALDGKPLPGAVVTFMPVGTPSNPDPGPTAAARTDADGKFRLAIDPARPGAVVGKHKVSISQRTGGPADDRDAGVGGRPAPRERVPDKYNANTALWFDVPAGGTDQANFDLTSR